MDPEEPIMDALSPAQLSALAKNLSRRLDLCVNALDVLGKLVHVQGDRITTLEDKVQALELRLKQAQADGY